MKPGPPKKPTALRRLEGNPSKRPYPKNEPQPDPSQPDCPEWLSDDAKEEWDRVAPQLNRLGLLTQIDRTALAAYCQSYAKWKHAEEFINQHGTTYRTVKEDDAGHKYIYSQQHAEVGIANQCLKQIRAFCTEFGMTPSARGGMELPDKKEDDGFLAKLREQMG
jgi:P27 family predicted phage terminase small subunit